MRRTPSHAAGSTTLTTLTTQKPACNDPRERLS
jgi:hypothetical protein